MGTCNFWTMKNFDLWAIPNDCFYFKFCPDCGFSAGDDETECSECSADLSDVRPVYDEWAAEIFCDELQNDLDTENKNLLFHKISIRSGYYAGLQLYVELSSYADQAGFTDDGPEYVDNESARYYFDMYRSQAVRRYESEQRKVNKILDRIGRAYGMDKLGVYARFSNGETWYTKIA